MTPGGTSPVITSPPQNKAERALFEEMQKGGWELTRRGFPDFACFRGNELIFVEVKPSRSYRLKNTQRRVMLALAERGIKCFRWSPDTKTLERISP